VIAFAEGRMRKFAGALFVVMLALIVVSAAALFGIYRASQQVPRFYQQALARSYAEAESGDRFERQALALHNQARQAGAWEARFSEEAINAWLAGVLPQKFPEALANGVSDPRVAIEGETVRLAVLYRKGSTSTVVSLAAQVHLTVEPNEVAVRIDDVRAGALPVPLARFLDEVTLRAAQAGLPLRWTEAGGKPVALVRLPLDPKAFKGRQLTLERLAFQDRELVVGGRTEELPMVDDLAGSADHPDEELASPAASETRQR
jgi:hypothetical protein